MLNNVLIFGSMCAGCITLKMSHPSCNISSQLSYVITITFTLHLKKSPKLCTYLFFYCLGNIYDSLTFLGIKTIIYKGEEMTANWEDGKLEITFYANCLPQTIKECSITLTLLKQECFEYPDESIPASYVYHIESSCKFGKALKVRIRHFATEKMIDNLMFAKCSSKTTPHMFHTIEAGTFTAVHGDIHLESFSFLTILYSRLFIKSYLISLHYFMDDEMLSQTCLSWKLYFSIIKNFPSAQSSKNRYFRENILPSNKPIIPPKGTIVRFQDNATYIKLNIPDSEKEIQPGWFLEPVTPQKLWKRDIDSYRDGHPPICEMKLIRKAHQDLSYLNYTFTFTGVDKTFIKIYICAHERKYTSNRKTIY